VRYLDGTIISVVQCCDFTGSIPFQNLNPTSEDNRLYLVWSLAGYQLQRNCSFNNHTISALLSTTGKSTTAANVRDSSETQHRYHRQPDTGNHNTFVHPASRANGEHRPLSPASGGLPASHRLWAFAQQRKHNRQLGRDDNEDRQHRRTIATAFSAQPARGAARGSHASSALGSYVAATSITASSTTVARSTRADVRTSDQAMVLHARRGGEHTEHRRGVTAVRGAPQARQRRQLHIPGRCHARLAADHAVGGGRLLPQILYALEHGAGESGYPSLCEFDPCPSITVRFRLAGSQHG
jgi:hypothetical protein